MITSPGAVFFEIMKFDLLFAEIVVADQDADFLRSIRVVLQAAGYSVRSKPDGGSVLEMVRARPPALLILGNHLQDMSGCDLIRTVRGDVQLPFIPVIFITSGQGGDHLTAALNAGADDVIHKPIINAELLVRVRAMLRLKKVTQNLADLNATLEQKVIDRTRQLEEAHNQLRHAEKLASLGRLAASIAHEINNPLTAILTYLGIMRMQAPPGGDIQEELVIIENQVHAIAKLVRELRDFSKPPRKERFPVVLNSILEEVLALTARDLQAHRIVLDVDLDPNLMPVMASDQQMAQVILNLVMNARDAMPDGGKLTIQSRSLDGDCCWVQIADTGVGIDETVLPHIFEPFFTTKGERGTGLGLSISYRIVEEHGGKVAVYSEAGKGTTFVIILPSIGKIKVGEDCVTCTHYQKCLVQETSM